MFRRAARLEVLLVAILAFVGFGIWRTATPGRAPTTRDARRSQSERRIVFDQSSLVTAEQLVKLPTASDERPFAEEAMRLADGEMDLAFASAVRRMAAAARADTPEARAADARLQSALVALSADQERVNALTSQLAKANAAAAEAIDDRLNLAKVQATLDQDEVDDARGDLRRAGGDPQGRMQEIIEAHDAASKASDSTRITVTPPSTAPGLLQRAQRLWALAAKDRQLDAAATQADSLAKRFKARHDTIDARSARAARDTSGGSVSHDSAATLLARATQRVRDAKARSALDERVENQRQLVATYEGWSAVLAEASRAEWHGVLQDIAAIVLIALFVVVGSNWLTRQIDANPIERRQSHTLLMVTRVSLQVVGVVIVLLVTFGRPDNFSTVLGLATAGLTVALKDPLLGFFGWFVLMGKKGIRVGDLVEVNGVTGEVVSIGVTQTEVLETGHWTDASHPTGRRVTIPNSFAIEGHYFNFSTSNRWLMDDVRIVVPHGRDPYPIAATLQAQVTAATTETARDAEAEWRASRRGPGAEVPSAAPSVTYKPIMGGVEISVRFLSSVRDRDVLRAQLFQTAVDLLGTGTKPAEPVASKA
jgi:hypothetical protein